MCASYSSCPLALNSEKYGCAPQPTNRSPSSSACTLPWLPDASGGELCSNCASTESVFAFAFNDSSSTRDCGCTVGTLPLSNTVIVPLPSTLASCWKAVAAPPFSLKFDCLPPICVITWPVAVSSSYIAHVLRAEISV